MGRLPRRRLYGRWDYTSTEVVREEAGFEPMETYIWKRNNTIAQYIVMRPIMNLCKLTDSKQGSRVGMHWWDHVVIDLEGAREMVVATAAAEAEAEADKDGLEE